MNFEKSFQNLIEKLITQQNTQLKTLLKILFNTHNQTPFKIQFKKIIYHFGLKK